MHGWGFRSLRFDRATAAEPGGALLAGLAAAVVGGAGIGVAAWAARSNQGPRIAVDSHNAAARSRVAQPPQVLDCKPVPTGPEVAARGRAPGSAPGNMGMAP